MGDISQNIRPYLGCDEEDEDKLSRNIECAIAAFRYHGNEHKRRLLHLRDSIPFSEEHAPGLFRESRKTSMPGPENWMIMQDCFFEIEGVRSTLEEYFPDEIDVEE